MLTFLPGCYGGPIYVMTGSLPLGSRPYQLAYEWERFC